MLEITNGVHVFEVTSGAFKTIFEPQGYHTTGPTVTAGKNASESVSGDVRSDDDAFLSSVIEKPVASWSKAELKRYASIESIDLGAAHSVADVRALVREHLS